MTESFGREAVLKTWDGMVITVNRNLYSLSSSFEVTRPKLGASKLHLAAALIWSQGSVAWHFPSIWIQTATADYFDLELFGLVKPRGAVGVEDHYLKGYMCKSLKSAHTLNQFLVTKTVDVSFWYSYHNNFAFLSPAVLGLVFKATVGLDMISSTQAHP